MPFIRVTQHSNADVIDINVNKIITFSQRKGNVFTTVDMADNITLCVKETPRQLRSFIKKAEGLLPEKETINIADSAFAPTIPVLEQLG